MLYLEFVYRFFVFRQRFLLLSLFQLLDLLGFRGLLLRQLWGDKKRNKSRPFPASSVASSVVHQ